MVEEVFEGNSVTKSTEEWLKQAEDLVPLAVAKIGEVKAFIGRWKNISNKVEQLPSTLSDLASHPCFTKNSLCKEQLQAVVVTLQETIKLATNCVDQNYGGKLQMQSNLDALAAKIDLNLHDCGLLVKTGVLGEATIPLTLTRSASGAKREAIRWNIRELLARLQIGHMESKHKALDSLIEMMNEDEKNILAAAGRSSVSALVQLLSASSPRIREKAATVICCLSEADNCDQLLVSEGALPPLVRLLESGSPLAKEKATLALQRLTSGAETARSVVGHGGIPALIEICQVGSPVTQTAAAGALRNLSAVPEVRQGLAEEGIISIAINLLDSGSTALSKEYASDCLQHLTSGHESLRRTVVSEGGIQHLLKYLDCSLPPESAIGSSTGNSHLDVGYLYRILRFLASYGIFAEQEEADQADDAATKKIKFGLTGISKLLVHGGNEQSCGPFLLLIASNVYLEAFQHLHESVLEGCYTFNKAHGMDPWEYLGNNPESNKIFNEAMATNTRSVMASVAKMYEDGFMSMATLVDVGGGMGSALSIIVKEHPHIRGINLDLPHVIATAPPITGVEHMEGNMFEHIPSADAVMMKWILHDWADEECVKLLRRSYDATPAKGKVLIVEAVVEGDKEGESMSRRLGLLYDILMMVYTTGGKERTEEEFKGLFQRAGFKSHTIIKLPFLQSLIVLSKV